MPFHSGLQSERAFGCGISLKFNLCVCNRPGSLVSMFGISKTSVSLELPSGSVRVISWRHMDLCFNLTMLCDELADSDVIPWRG
jgi:hypothetical protein